MSGTAALEAIFRGDPEHDPDAFLDQGGMHAVETRVLVGLRRQWLGRIEDWLADEGDDWMRRRLTEQVKRLRRQLGITRSADERRAASRERVRRHRQKKKSANVQD